MTIERFRKQNAFFSYPVLLLFPRRPFSHQLFFFLPKKKPTHTGRRLEASATAVSSSGQRGIIDSERTRRPNWVSSLSTCLNRIISVLRKKERNCHVIRVLFTFFFFWIKGEKGLIIKYTIVLTFFFLVTICGPESRNVSSGVFRLFFFSPFDRKFPLPPEGNPPVPPCSSLSFKSWALLFSFFLFVVFFSSSSPFFTKFYFIFFLPSKFPGLFLSECVEMSSITTRIRNSYLSTTSLPFWKKLFSFMSSNSQWENQRK